MKKLLIFFSILILLFSLGCSSNGNDPDDVVTDDTTTEDTDDTDDTLTGSYTLEQFGEVTTELPSYVNIMFQVKNTDGDPITSFTTDVFEVEENGNSVSPTESAMRIRKQDEIPYSLYTVLMLDNSISVGENIEEIKSAAIELIKTADDPEESERDGNTGNQQFLVYTFSDSYEKITPSFTNDVSELTTAINEIIPGYNSTNLYGSIVEGVSNWNDSYSTSDITQGFLVLLTDGSDTQASSTFSEAESAIGDKKVITVGVGDEVEPTILEDLATSGFYEMNDYSQLADQFISIQTNMEAYANSFYWLDYLSPVRGDKQHELTLSVKNNSNSYSDAEISSSFNSANFYSIRPGLYINDNQSNTDGISTIKMGENSTFLLELNTYLSSTGGIPNKPEYTVTSDGGGTVVNIDQDTDAPSYFFLTATGSAGDTCTLTAKDTSNDFTETLSLNILETYFTENWENSNEQNWNINLGWDDALGITDSPERGSVLSGDYLFELRGDTNTLTSPVIDASTATIAVISFYAAVYSLDSSYETLEFDVYDGSSWNNVKSIGEDKNGMGYDKYEFEVPDTYDLTNLQIRFRAEASGNGDYMNIDDILVYEQN